MCKDAPYRSYTPYIALGSRRGISSVIRPFGGLVQRGALDFLPNMLPNSGYKLQLCFHGEQR